MTFDDLDDLEDHMDECDAPLIDNIPTNAFGKHACPICKKKYITANFLGEHFIIAHSDYSELEKLDVKEKMYHPGFDIMIYIGMIEPFRETDVHDLIEQNEKCVICFNKYKYDSNNMDDMNDTEDTDEIGNIDDISNVDIDDVDNIDDIDIDIDDVDNVDNIDDIDDVDDIDNETLKKILPCITKCCQRHLCRDCFEQCVGYNNKLKCPFCKKDFEKVTHDYVIIYEDSNTTNSSWRQWWEQHLDIFD